MGNLHNNGFIKDKKFLLTFVIALICSIICGIVLYKTAVLNEYLLNFADDYVFFVFNFENSALLVPKILTDIVYFYIVFAICYFTKFKYLSIIPLFLRGVFFGIYTSILIVVNSFSGTVVAIFVFIPASLVSFALCYIICEYCKIIYKKYAFVMPLAFSVINLAVYALLINLLFRLVIIIV